MIFLCSMFFKLDSRIYLEPLPELSNNTTNMFSVNFDFFTSAFKAFIRMRCVPYLNVLLFILLMTPIVFLHLTVCTVHWTKGRRGTSSEPERKLEEPEELQAHVFSAGWPSSHNKASFLADRAAVTTDTVYCPFSWLTQWTQPCCSSQCCSFGGAHVSGPHKVSHDQARTLWGAIAVL